MNLLEVEPAGSPATAPGPDIPAPRAACDSGFYKQMQGSNRGVNLTHEQVRRLEDKDGMKHNKRYEAHVGAKTT